MIVTEHQESCPWKGRGCIDSIQRIPGLHGQSNVRVGLRERLQSMKETQSLPNVHFHYSSQDEAQDDSREVSLDDCDFAEIDEAQDRQDALKLAICGWYGSSSSTDVLECRSCFRTLGLWLYTGEEPVVDKLNAIESHLEYCPWRSETAQGTEISEMDVKKKLCGWQLVIHGLKRRRTASVLSRNIEAEETEDVPAEEREKKTKELLRRIKELKKPFNVRSLLQRKKKPEEQKTSGRTLSHKT